MDLYRRTVLVTGASSGIGAATARLMSSRGAVVVLVARREDRLRDVAASLPGPAHVAPCDVGDPEAVTRMAARVVDVAGVPDVLVNNAGAGRWLWIEETSPEEFLAQVAVPLHAAFFVTRAFVEPMLERRRGWVVTVNSPISQLAWPGALGYGVARWGLRGFDECLARDLRGTGIGVSAVVAGHTDSEYFDANPGALDRLPWVDRYVPRLTSLDVGRMVVRAVEQERRHLTAPWPIRAANVSARLWPGLVARVTSATGARREGRSKDPRHHSWTRTKPTTANPPT